MKNIFAACILTSVFLCHANCPKELSGTWIGNYTDNGPYDGTVPIELILKTDGNKISGYTANDANYFALSNEAIHGICKAKKIEFYLIESPDIDLQPPPSQVSLINPNELKINLHWQGQMAGGSGPALVEKEIVNKKS